MNVREGPWKDCTGSDLPVPRVDGKARSTTDNWPTVTVPTDALFFFPLFHRRDFTKGERKEWSCATRVRSRWSGISRLTANPASRYSRFAAVRACDDGGSSLDRKLELENPPAQLHCALTGHRSEAISRGRPRATPRDYLGYRHRPPLLRRFGKAPGTNLC
jgi:hypothetical protein